MCFFYIFLDIYVEPSISRENGDVFLHDIAVCQAYAVGRLLEVHIPPEVGGNSCAMPVITHFLYHPSLPGCSLLADVLSLLCRSIAQRLQDERDAETRSGPQSLRQRPRGDVRRRFGRPPFPPTPVSWGSTCRPSEVGGACTLSWRSLLWHRINWRHSLWRRQIVWRYAHFDVSIFYPLSFQCLCLSMHLFINISDSFIPHYTDKTDTTEYRQNRLNWTMILRQMIFLNITCCSP